MFAALLLTIAAQDTFVLEAAWGPIASSTYHLQDHHSAVAETFTRGPSTPRAEHPLSALRALFPRYTGLSRVAVTPKA